MDYEKKYKESLERARHLHTDAIAMEDSIRAKQCEIIFPELKESEDERIRKALISVLKSDFENDTTIHDISVGDIIAWLEKQGEHAIACSEEQIKVLNEVLNFAANHESPYWNNYIFETLNNLIRQLKNLIYDTERKGKSL